MGYLTLLEVLGLRIAVAGVIGFFLLMYMKQKLKEKVDKTELNDIKEKNESNLSKLKIEIVEMLKEKLDTSNKIMEITVNKIEAVFETQNQKMQGIIDVQIKSLDAQIKMLNEKRE